MPKIILAIITINILKKRSKKKNEVKEELKDEMKNRISMALKAPVLQQGFEIICKRIAELEKDNAELQEKLNTRSCQNCKHNNKSCSNDGSCVHYSKWEDCRNSQLAKAKAIIKDLLSVLPKENIESVYEVTEEAEEFLREVEE